MATPLQEQQARNRIAAIQRTPNISDAVKRRFIQAEMAKLNSAPKIQTVADLNMQAPGYRGASLYAPSPFTERPRYTDGPTKNNLQGLRTIADNNQNVSVGGGARGRGGVSYVNVGGVSIPTYGHLAGQAKYSTAWNQGTRSLSDEFGIRKAPQAAGKYSSGAAMQGIIKDRMSQAPKYLQDPNRWLNQRDMYRNRQISNKHIMQPYQEYQTYKDRVAKFGGPQNARTEYQKGMVRGLQDYEKRFGGQRGIVGRERMGAKGNMITKTGNIEEQMKRRQTSLPDARMPSRYQGASGYQRANDESIAAKEQMRRVMDPLKGWSPTTSNVRVKETYRGGSRL